MMSQNIVHIERRSLPDNEHLKSKTILDFQKCKKNNKRWYQRALFASKPHPRNKT